MIKKTLLVEKCLDEKKKILPLSRIFSHVYALCVRETAIGLKQKN